MAIMEKVSWLLQDAEIKLAKENGTYNESGIIKPRGETIAFKRKDVSLLFQTVTFACCRSWAHGSSERFVVLVATLKLCTD